MRHKIECIIVYIHSVVELWEISVLSLQERRLLSRVACASPEPMEVSRVKHRAFTFWAILHRHCSWKPFFRHCLQEPQALLAAFLVWPGLSQLHQVIEVVLDRMSAKTESTEHLHVTIISCYCGMKRINWNTVDSAQIMHCSHCSAEFIVMARK